MRPRAQTVALAAIGIADLVTTLLFVGLANAAEANPLMAPFLERGPITFIQAKLTLLLAPLFVIEVARKRNPTFVRNAVNAAIVMYVGLYVVGVSHVNGSAPKYPSSIPPNTQAYLDAKRKEMGLPPGPPLTILKRAEAQRNASAAKSPHRGQWIKMPSTQPIGMVEIFPRAF
jgi:hypothetical protein